MAPMHEDKIAVVTGGSRGIGRAIVLEMAKNGAFVYFNYAKNEKAASEVLNCIKQLGGKGEAIKCSVTDVEHIKSMFHKIIKDNKRIDILVNSAGITRDGFLMMMQDKDWETVIRTNLFGPYYCTKHVMRAMYGQRSGVIINIGSVSGIIGVAGQSNYGASKAAVMSFTRTTAKELAEKGG